ncbi:MAG: gliding motility protein GldM [Bacteroidetes bacterium]|nr:gliding motility protein GldM [Bacteroidota bacterium]
MASAKETPRQKMIGMMYLVLTALLALNVSKDILDAFIVVDKGLQNTNLNFIDRNENLYAQFDLAKSVDPVKVQPNWQKAQDVKKRSAELFSYIDQLQKQLIKETDGISADIADTIQMANISSKDNYDTPTNILIGDSEDGSKGASRELKNKLNEFKKTISAYIAPEDQKKVSIDINTDDPKASENNENWEMYNFYHRPLVASLTILSKLKNDVKNAESTVVDYLLKEVDDGNLKFDTVAAKVIAQSNYVLLGEEYKADLFVAAFSKTKDPEVLVGDYNESTKSFSTTPNKVETQKGMGKYTVKTNKEGIVSYSGVIKMTSPKGKEMQFPFKSEYIVAKPALTVAVEKMNVVYRGLDNPISVSVPGIPTERLSVSATNATLVNLGNGQFNLIPTGDGVANVNVIANMENGEKRNMGTMTLRIKRIPKPVAKLGNITSEGSMSKGEFDSKTTLEAYYDNFPYQATCKVTSFTMSYLTNGVIGSVNISGNNISDQLKTIYKSLKRGSKVYFENIIGVGPDGQPNKLGALTVKVN